MSSNRLYGPVGVPNIAATVPLNASGAAAAVLPALQTILTTAETTLVNPSLPTTPLLVSIPPQSPLEGRIFEIVASGYLNLGTSSTATLKLYSGTSLTPGSNTSLGSSGAISAFSGKAPWYVIARLVFDSVSGKLQGTIKFMVNNTLVAEVAVANVVTGLNNAGGVNGAPVANFVLTVTFASAGTQTINVAEFAINY